MPTIDTIAGKRICHNERFSIPRIPLVLIFLNFQQNYQIMTPQVPLKPILTEIPDTEIVALCNEEETIQLAEETLEAWEQMRRGGKKLMRMYPVRVRGYCPGPRVHVGPSGHKAQNCSAVHTSTSSETGPPLWRELRSFYGQAPAVVEIYIFVELAYTMQSTNVKPFYKPYEPEESTDTNCSGEHEECISYNQHIPEVQNSRYWLCDLKLGEKVAGSIEEWAKRLGT
ncbi:hypothetical protein V6N12_007081 [Hibiscus sabdariffa]|uniref:APO domain-containing protein n=1 Tax=Hibiscus sabdariffa TaxID=183260 RepID=A0ABR2F0R7_9ROSI